ncbi:MAG: hypothetical protein AB1540_00045 [Bdellovibrionota bacterium]
MRFFCAFLLAWVVIVFSGSDGFATSNRTKNRVGFYVAGNGDPAVSAAGINAGLNLGDMFRLNAGIGGANSSFGDNIGKALYNGTVAPLGYFLSWIVYQMFVNPFSRRAGPDYRDFRRRYDPGQSIFTYGAGAKVFVPGLSFSPVAGIGFSRYSSKRHPYGLDDSGSHAYYSAGVDWQSSSGFNLGAGYNICPKLSDGACGIYVNIGGFF